MPYLMFQCVSCVSERIEDTLFNHVSLSITLPMRMKCVIIRICFLGRWHSYIEVSGQEDLCRPSLHTAA